MKQFREFEIGWTGLKEGKHEFHYELNDEKLSLLGYSSEEFSDLEAKIQLTFDRHHDFFELFFDYDGHLTCICDRCGDPMTLELWDEFKLIVKLVDSAEDADRYNEVEESEIYYISHHTSSINVFKWLYDYLMLSIPIQKVHGTDEEGRSLCNEQAIALLASLEEQSNKSASIWKDLEKFKKK